MHSPMFPRKQVIAHLSTKINWCVGFSVLQTLALWFRTETQTLPAPSRLQQSYGAPALGKLARPYSSLALLKTNSDDAVAVRTCGQAIRDTIGAPCPGSQQSHMHPWVLMCSHLGRKEISASHRSTFCWLCRDEEELENRNFGLRLSLIDQPQV